MEGEDPMDLFLSYWMIEENTLFIGGIGSKLEFESRIHLIP